MIYRKKAPGQLEFEDFNLPFGGKLRSDNRWVRLSKLIPWEKVENEYAYKFSQKMGAPAKPIGRPKKEDAGKDTKEQAYRDACDKVAVEGKLG